jgi:hypothetical protein
MSEFSVLQEAPSSLSLQCIPVLFSLATSELPDALLL